MPKFRMPRPRKKIDARVRSAAPPMIDDYDAEEPQTKLSTAFIVVFVLHVVAIGGIYTFNSIKASRKDQETPASQAQAASKAAATPAVEQDNTAGLAHSAAVAVPVPAIGPVSASPKHYFVKQGDTLTSIAKSTGVGVAELEAANSLKPATMLHIGQQLVIPAKGAAKPAVETAKLDTPPKKADDAPPAPARTYTVKGGDRLLFIAKRFNVSPDELIAVNKIKDPAKLQIGQSLKIPAKKTN